MTHPEGSPPSESTLWRRASRRRALFKAYVERHYPRLTGDRAIDAAKLDRLYRDAHAAADADRWVSGLDWVKVCRHCGDRFESRRSDALYCSAFCRGAPHRTTPAVAVCARPECGKEFEPRPRERYCSDLCRAAVDRKRKRGQSGSNT